MRSPKKGRPPRLTLADLKQPGTITCLTCEKEKPAEGSRPYRAHRVCAECVARLENLPQPKP